jgi:hypothetical protein
MSLFDVLRYPISDVPTNEELENIPIELYNDVFGNVVNVPIRNGNVAAVILRIMLRQPKNKEKAQGIIKLLRQRIRNLP